MYLKQKGVKKYMSKIGCLIFNFVFTGKKVFAPSGEATYFSDHSTCFNFMNMYYKYVTMQ